MLYIFDLEGTVGIFDENMAALRAGTAEAFRKILDGKNSMCIATRKPFNGAEADFNRLKHAVGFGDDVKLFSKDDIQLSPFNLATMAFKDYGEIYKFYGIGPEEAVVFGDFLRFRGSEGYTELDYMATRFSAEPRHLSYPTALNDHPAPLDRKQLPLYVVVPQPWTTETTIPMDEIVKAATSQENCEDVEHDGVYRSMARFLAGGDRVHSPTGDDITNVFGIKNQRYRVVKCRIWKSMEAL